MICRKSKVQKRTRRPNNSEKISTLPSWQARHQQMMTDIHKNTYLHKWLHLCCFHSLYTSFLSLSRLVSLIIDLIRFTLSTITYDKPLIALLSSNFLMKSMRKKLHDIIFLYKQLFLLRTPLLLHTNKS